MIIISAIFEENKIIPLELLQMILYCFGLVLSCQLFIFVNLALLGPIILGCF